MRTASILLGLNGLFLFSSNALKAQSTLQAQDPRKLEFEVASVRVSAPLPPDARNRGRGGLIASNPERLIYERVLFRQLLMDAYDVQRDQIKGPAWAIADAADGGMLFDVSAKITPGATKQQVGVMLQNLLKERFQLAVHRSTIEFSGYALVTAKGGPKIKTSSGPLTDSERREPVPGPINLKSEKDGFPELFPAHNVGGTFKDGLVRMRFRDYPLSGLVQQFSFALAAHIIDKTGLEGKYDFTLEFAPPENGIIVGVLATLPLNAGQTAAVNVKGPDPGQIDAAPIVSSAMEKQLGLKLEPAKITTDSLVIDHVEKIPAEN